MMISVATAKLCKSPLLLFLLLLLREKVGALPCDPNSYAACWVHNSNARGMMVGSASRTLRLSGRGSTAAWQPRRRERGPVRRGTTRAVSTMVVGSSAATKARRKENVPGNLFVDESCIDCDTCRWMQGDTFVSLGGKSAVARQPTSDEKRRGAYRAMFACPTSSIRVETADPVAKEALDDFPFPVDEERLPGVFHLGFHAENSFGCSPWFVQRPEGNVMMDSPRFHSSLAKGLERKGGVSLMVMSHIDDVADHQRWKNRFPEMRRVMHKADVQRYGDTENVEVQLEESSADGRINGFDYWDLAEDLRVLHTPGHSLGSITLLFNPPLSKAGSSTEVEGIAFTGDHLAMSGRTGALTGFPMYGHDHVMQSKSMELLAQPDVNFRWILPGHGRMIRFNSHEERVSQIKAAAAHIKAGRS
eukprot:jgi/Undpi1/8368/HiC_scaffold_25.g10836.m1